MSYACFLTGTDTEVGKTHIACALLHRARSAGHVAVGLKPVAAGTDAVTICGTTGSFRGAAETALLLKKAMDDGLGTDSNPEFTGALMGWMCERCDDVTIGNEWICSDPYVQRDHAEDPFDAFTSEPNLM